MRPQAPCFKCETSHTEHEEHHAEHEEHHAEHEEHHAEHEEHHAEHEEHHAECKKHNAERGKLYVKCEKLHKTPKAYNYNRQFMHNLLDFVRKYSYFFLFILLEVASMVLLFRFNNYQGSVWFSAANSAVANVDALYGKAVSYVNLGKVNSELTAENVRLQRETEQLREMLHTYTRDTTQTERLMLQTLKDYTLISATVVSNSNERNNNYLVIDKGESEGVRTEMGVVGGGGVVGIVYLTGPHHSLVIPVTNRKSSISCRVRGQSYFGYLQWDGSSMRSAYVDDIPRYARVKKGEVIETSGYSAVFPPGIFVGRIRSIQNSPDGQSYKLSVGLGTNFANLRDVQVVATPYKAELDTLQAHAAAMETGN